MQARPLEVDLPDDPDLTTASWPGPESASGPAAAFLIVTGAPRAEQVGRSFLLPSSGEWLLGRGSDADLRLDDRGISRHHARLKRAGPGEYTLVDLGSANGTFVNGTRVRRALLREGDRIQLGTATVLRFSRVQQLEDGERRLRQALAAGGVGTWEWEAGQGTLSFAGAPGNAPARPTDGWSAVHPDDVARLRDDLARALFRGGTAALECRVLGEDGRIAWICLQGEVLRDESSRPVRIAGAVVDVTARKQAELEVRRQALMFECMAEGVIVVDFAGTVLDWNPAARRLLGWSRDEVVGRSPAEFLGADAAALFLPPEAGAPGGADLSRREARLPRKGGGACEVEIGAVPLRDPEGSHIAHLVVCRDVGEQRRLQAQLLLADRLAAMGTLAAGVAHEINNPLSFIQSNLNYLQEMLAGTGDLAAKRVAEARSVLAEMGEGLDRIWLIARDLKAQGRDAPSGTGAADVGRAVEYALRILRAEIRRSARLIRDEGDIPPVSMPEPQLGQVLVNLLLNATQAVEGGPARNEIAVRIREEGEGAVSIRVSDTGRGIPAEVLPRIFESFYTTKPAGIGTGLGLFVCRKLIEAAGGTIGVESRVGSGTTFTVTLPRAAAKSPP